MRRLLIPTAVLAGLVLVLVLVSIGYYNSFISKEQAVESQWAQVETQYQRRFDLIPNLVSAVEGIFEQEREIFKDLADARSRYAGSRSVEDRVEAANQVESALARLLVIVENYPNLRSSESVQQLQAQLEGTENRISVERRRYNEEVRGFNTSVKRFPGLIYAAILGFEEKPFFESQEGAERAPKVEF